MKVHIQKYLCHSEKITSLSCLEHKIAIDTFIKSRRHTFAWHKKDVLHNYSEAAMINEAVASLDILIVQTDIVEITEFYFQPF